MAAQRNRKQRKGGRTKSQNLGFVKPGFEDLERRLAPGSMMDLFGMAALGDIAGNSNSPLATNVLDSARPSIIGTANRTDGLGRSLSNEVLSTDDLDLRNRLAIDTTHESKGVDLEPDLLLSDWYHELRVAPSALKLQWKSLDSLIESNEFSNLSLSGSSNDLDVVTNQRLKQSSVGSGSFHLPGSAFQPNQQSIGTGQAQPVWTSQSDAGLAGGQVDMRVDSAAASGNPVPASVPSGTGDEAELPGSLQLSGQKSTQDLPKFDEHRLPPELRNRSDELLAGQALHPTAINYASPQLEPTTGNVRSPAEYEPMRGVVYSYSSYTSVVTDLVKELTEDPNTDDIAYVVVTSAAQQTSATNAFVSAGANMSKVQFIIQPMNSVWMRDYGPHFTTVDDALSIVDSHYYPTRSLDNFIPTLVGDNNFVVPTYDVGLYFSGGNFQPGPNNSGFVTALINSDNPSADGFDSGLIAELYNRYLGIDTLHVLPQLPFSVDGTGHIDMWMYLIDEKTVIISEFLAGSNATAIQITDNAVGYMENLGFKVYRTPAWNSGGTHYTYANAFRVNNRIFVPVYGTALKPGGSSAYNSRDAQAMATWQEAAGPGVEIIPIQCFSIINAAGAIHCIVKQVPRYTGSAPAVNILSPAGGEVLTPGTQYKVEWSAIDTNNVSPSEISIFVSYGDGDYRHLATTADTGSYLWTLEEKVSRAESATIKIVAKSAGGNKTEVVSSPFSISPGRVTTYDFSTGAGIDKFAFGTQTTSWSNVNGNPSPLSNQLTTTNYARLATSNASGGNDADTNRYIAPIPSPSSTSESTHLFTFQLDAAIDRMAQLDVVWEGYADFASQVELYIWDRVASNWGDGRGLTGMNRYMDSWAGNLDGLLTGSIRSDFSRYVDEAGIVRFLVYTDRPGAVGNPGSGVETFHDYMSVRVKEIDFRIPVREA